MLLAEGNYKATPRAPDILQRRIGKFVPVRAPRISVIIPAYNVSAYIAETLDGILAQTFTDYEIILVNDGSDDTVALEECIAPYIEYTVYIKQHNGGASAARNAAIDCARGALLAFLDGDDIWRPDYLQHQLRFLQSSGLDMVYCDAKLFGEFVFQEETYMQNAVSIGPVNTQSLLDWTCNVITSGTIVRTELVREAGLFDLSLLTHQDFDLWFSLAKRGAKIGYNREVLIGYRVRPDGISGSNLKIAERNIDSLKSVARKYALTEDEDRILKRQFDRSLAMLSLEKAKVCVVKGEFDLAREYLKKANEYYQAQKLVILAWLLKAFPQLVRLAFRGLRASEFSAINADSQ